MQQQSRHLLSGRNIQTYCRSTAVVALRILRLHDHVELELPGTRFVPMNIKALEQMGETGPAGNSSSSPPRNG